MFNPMNVFRSLGSYLWCPILNHKFIVFQTRNLSLQVEQEIQRRSLIQTDYKNQSSELAKFKTKEKHLFGVRFVFVIKNISCLSTISVFDV